MQRAASLYVDEAKVKAKRSGDGSSAHTCAHTHALTHSLTHTHSHTHAHTHAHTHTLTHTYLSITQVHAVEVACPYWRLITTSTTTNFEHNVSIVKRVPATTKNTKSGALLLKRYFLRAGQCMHWDIEIVFGKPTLHTIQTPNDVLSPWQQHNFNALLQLFNLLLKLSNFLPCKLNHLWVLLRHPFRKDSHVSVTQKLHHDQRNTRLVTQKGAVAFGCMQQVQLPTSSSYSWA